MRNVSENEEQQYKLMGIIEKALHDVISVEGKISKVQKYGNSVVIKFENGNIYKQPLITKNGFKKIITD